MTQQGLSRRERLRPCSRRRLRDPSLPHRLQIRRDPRNEISPGMAAQKVGRPLLAAFELAYAACRSRCRASALRPAGRLGVENEPWLSLGRRPPRPRRLPPPPLLLRCPGVRGAAAAPGASRFHRELWSGVVASARWESIVYGATIMFTKQNAAYFKSEVKRRFSNPEARASSWPQRRSCARQSCGDCNTLCPTIDCKLSLVTEVLQRRETLSHVPGRQWLCACARDAFSAAAA